MITAGLAVLRQAVDRLLGSLIFPNETLLLSKTNRPPGLINFADSLFLYAAARLGGGKGWIVEIGSYKGASTAYLALGAIHAGRDSVLACDPHYEGTHQEFQHTVRSFQLEKVVKPAVMTSEECVSQWHEPVRLLWIDGDHSYAGVQKDVRLWSRHLIPGGVIALHDYTWEGPNAVLREEILTSSEFCEVGYLANIAYASKEFCATPNLFRRFRRLEKIRRPLAIFARKTLG